MEELKIGGQAIIEGVTMRSSHYVASSVRKENGKIKTKIKKFIPKTEKSKFFGFPFVRGIFSLFEMLSLGYKEIQWSASQAGEGEAELTKTEMVISVLIALIMVIVLFKFIPWFLASLISDYFSSAYFVTNIIDGIIKIIIITAYMLLIGLLKDVKTLFKYHGAEHKAVNCYESGKKLTPKNAKKFTKIHPRCGTTFIIIVFVMSIFVYTLIPFDVGFWLNLLIRVALLPIIAGISYEIIRFTGKYYEKSAIIRVIMWPGLQFQRLTTNEPSLDQLEVSIKSLEACLVKEKALKSR